MTALRVVGRYALDAETGKWRRATWLEWLKKTPYLPLKSRGRLKEREVFYRLLELIRKRPKEA